MRTSILLLSVGMLGITHTDAQPNRWVNTGVGSPARQNALGFSIEGKIYTCLGIDQDGALLTDLWQYDPATETWQEKAAFAGAARTGAVCFTVGGKAYVATGVAAGDTLNDLWEYDPLTDAWAQKADLPGSARMNACAFSIGGYGYVCAGTGPPVQGEEYDMYPDLGDLWAYDPVLDNWTQRADLFPSLINGNLLTWSSFTLDGKGYAITQGSGDEGPVGKVWAYDPVGDVWMQKADINDPAVSVIGFAVGGHGYLVNMGVCSITLTNNPLPTHPNKVLKYDPIDDTWAISGYFSGLSRDNVAVATSGPIAYIMGGAHYYEFYDPGPTSQYRLHLPELWSYDVRDCQGVVDGPVNPGDPCDDGNTGTYNDAYDLSCTCTGSAQNIQPFHPDQIDNTFNTGIGFDNEVLAMLLQPDGKSIATGPFTQFNGTQCNGIARLNSDGSLDAGFNGAIGGRALALQPDGKILVGGDGITRLMPDGSMDPTFDTYLSGIGTQPINALAVRPNGLILAGGSAITLDEWGNEVSIALVQLTADGALDPSFNAELTNSTAVRNVLTLSLHPDGRVLVGMDNTNYEFSFNLNELNADGSYNTAANMGFSFPDPVRAVAYRVNGEIVAGGDFHIYNDDPWIWEGIPRERLAVIGADGHLVNTFDPGSSTNGSVRALAVGPQGQIVAGGDFSEYRSEAHNAIVQLNDHGYADPSFASGAGFNAAVNAMVLAPDGQLIVGGAFTSYNGTACGRITRLRTPGPLCLPSQLTTTADPVISCGAVNLKLNGTSTIAATEVLGANKYQFRFTNVPGQPAYTRNIALPTRSFTLTKWYTNPLKAGRTYNVVVRASFDDGATWCDYGPSCTVRISWTPMVPGMEPRHMEVAWQDVPELRVHPNPTNGANMRLRSVGIDPGLEAVTLDITDLFGKRVMSATLPINDGELDTGLSLNGDLSNGVYIARIHAGSDILFGRFTLAR